MRRPKMLLLVAATCAVASQPATAIAKSTTGGPTTAIGQVFLPNPVADLGIQTLTDQKDADYFSGDPLLSKAYHRVTLTNLDGSGTLAGDYAKVISKTGQAAAYSGDGFVYTRNQDEFEQVMGYYWVTQAQRYIQSLGFGSALPAVNRRQQLLRIDQFGGDNSFYREQAPAASAHRPVRRGQLVLPRRHRQAHDHARQGRGRRRRRRRGDRARVRPLRAGRPSPWLRNDA